MTEINKRCEAKKKMKEDNLASAECVALTGDHWPSVSNNDYLDVTAIYMCVYW